MSKEKEIEVVIVSYQQYTDYEFIEPGSYFVMSASQDYYFFKTSDRAKAQQKCNELFGENKYLVKSGKMTKSKSRREDGGYSAMGSNSRKGFAPQLKKTN